MAAQNNRPQLRRSPGEEFNRGSTYERYSGEQTRARVTGEGAALGGVAASAAAASSSLAGAKLAGTPLGQAGLRSAESKLRLSAKTGSKDLGMAADQVARYRRYGAWAGRHKAGTAAGILGAGAVAGVARLGQKARQNEEAGISQGIGRMKAGEHYGRVRQSAVHKATMQQLALGSDIIQHPKIAPLARKVADNRGRLTAAGGALVTTGGGITLARTGQKHDREYRKLRGELRPVSKAIPGVLLGGRGWALSGAATGAVGVGGAEAARRKGHQETSEKLIASTVGGWAGQGAYQGVTYGLKHKGLHEERKAHLTRSAKDKSLKEVKRQHGPFTAEMYRHYPKKTTAGRPMPGWKVNRAAGWVGRGKLGQAIGTGATAAGSIAGMRYVTPPQRGGHGRRQPVAKLYVRDQQTSMPRLLEAGAGLALGAWGVGRSRMVGAALGRGLKMATSHQNPYAIQALQTAIAAQGVLARGTAPGERALRQIRAVDRAVSRVPNGIRPEIAMAAGTLLVGHARPIRRESYHPVNIRIRTNGGF